MDAYIATIAIKSVSQHSEAAVEAVSEEGVATEDKNKMPALICGFFVWLESYV